LEGGGKESGSAHRRAPRDAIVTPVKGEGKKTWTTIDNSTKPQIHLPEKAMKKENNKKTVESNRLRGQLKGRARTGRNETPSKKNPAVLLIPGEEEKGGFKKKREQPCPGVKEELDRQKRKGRGAQRGEGIKIQKRSAPVKPGRSGRKKTRQHTT